MQVRAELLGATDGGEEQKQQQQLQAMVSEVVMKAEGELQQARDQVCLCFWQCGCDLHVNDLKLSERVRVMSVSKGEAVFNTH